MFYYVYIIKLNNKKFYIWYSSILRSRIKEHNEGKVRQTRYLRPLKLIYYAAFRNKLKAIYFEKYLKTPSGYAFRNNKLI